MAVDGEKAGDPYTKEDVVGLMDFNWYIVLQMNPDGYQYSHTEDRMWRKNRSSNNGHFCKGVDLNRQFPVGHLTLGLVFNQFSWNGASESESFLFENLIKAVLQIHVRLLLLQQIH